MINAAMKAAILNELNSAVGNGCTTVNKYDLFIAARSETKEFIRYREVRDEIEDIVRDWAAENDFEVKVNYVQNLAGDTYREYELIPVEADDDSDEIYDDEDDEDDEDEFRIFVGSRRRITIPSAALCLIDGFDWYTFAFSIDDDGVITVSAGDDFAAFDSEVRYCTGEYAQVQFVLPAYLVKEGDELICTAVDGRLEIRIA